MSVCVVVVALLLVTASLVSIHKHDPLSPTREVRGLTRPAKHEQCWEHERENNPTLPHLTYPNCAVLLLLSIALWLLYTLSIISSSFLCILLHDHGVWSHTRPAEVKSRHWTTRPDIVACGLLSHSVDIAVIVLALLQNSLEVSELLNF